MRHRNRKTEIHRAEHGEIASRGSGNFRATARKLSVTRSGYGPDWKAGASVGDSAESCLAERGGVAGEASKPRPVTDLCIAF